jgi:hypothetical protein
MKSVTKDALTAENEGLFKNKANNAIQSNNLKEKY